LSSQHLERSPATAGFCRTYGADAVEGARPLHQRVLAEIVAAVEDLKGTEAARILRSSGVEMLHTVIDPLDLGPLRDRVLDRLRNELLRMAVNVGRSVMGWDGEFYVDDYIILRLNLPYDTARNADAAAENPGIGRLSPSVRAAAAQRKVKDAVYDPKSYHRGHSPAAWAHGAHVDSWSGHSKDGLNLWWAMCDVPGEAGMVVYPELAGAQLPSDPRTLYLRSGYQLPPPTFVPLAAGEMLIFDPEILHGSHLNVTPRTRVAVSMRLNARRPSFDPACFYAREFWRRASDVERGADEVLHLKREEHLAERAPSCPAPPIAVRTVSATHAAGASAVALGPSSSVAEGERIVAALPGRRVVVLRTCGRLAAFDAACPHYGVDLADGGTRAGAIHCPGCAVRFDVETGRSASPCLTLRRYPIREDGGTMVLDLGE
jgi:nitrite reductase/ring-hydroxylating ferredoxin subunit